MQYFQVIVFLMRLITLHTQFYQSKSLLSAIGFECQPHVSTDRLPIINGVRSVILCAAACNQQPLCSYFDYDSSAMVCRTFKDGLFVASASPTSRAGRISYTPDLYSSYSQRCAQDNGEINRYLVCNAVERCQCPSNLVWNSEMCVVNNFSYSWNSTGITVAGISGYSGSALNQLGAPVSVALDASNALYISDYYSNQVRKWLANSSSGTIIAGSVNGASGGGLSHLYGPFGIALDSNSGVYVADAWNNRVVFSANGSSSGILVAGTGTSGSANYELSYPQGVALDLSTGTLYISDSGNSRVMQYLPNATTGNVVAGGNGAETSNTQLYNPRGIYYDVLSNSLLIANTNAHNVVRWVLNSSSWILIAGSNTGLSGNTSNLFMTPRDVKLDFMGNIYVADEDNARIQFFQPNQTNGTTIAGETGVIGSTPQLFYGSCAVAIDNQLNLYVADFYNARVQKFLRT